MAKNNYGQISSFSTASNLLFPLTLIKKMQVGVGNVRVQQEVGRRGLHTVLTTMLDGGRVRVDVRGPQFNGIATIRYASPTKLLQEMPDVLFDILCSFVGEDTSIERAMLESLRENACFYSLKGTVAGEAYAASQPLTHDQILNAVRYVRRRYEEDAAETLHTDAMLYVQWSNDEEELREAANEDGMQVSLGSFLNMGAWLHFRLSPEEVDHMLLRTARLKRRRDTEGVGSSNGDEPPNKQQVHK